MPHTDLFWRTFRPAEGFYTSEVQAPDACRCGPSCRPATSRTTPIRCWSSSTATAAARNRSCGWPRAEPAQLHLHRPARARSPLGRGRTAGCATPGDRTATATRWSRITCSGPSSKPGAAITSIPSGSTWPASAKGRPWPIAWACSSRSASPASSPSTAPCPAGRPAAALAGGPAAARVHRPRHRQRRGAPGAGPAATSACSTPPACPCGCTPTPPPTGSTPTCCATSTAGSSGKINEE